MGAPTDELLDAALKLPPDDRARLASELVASLDGEAETAVEENWAAEIENRASEIESGTVTSLEWKNVKAANEERLRRR